jgi:hypothetical protein
MGKKALFLNLWAVLFILTASLVLAGTDFPSELKNAVSPYPGAKVIQTMNMKNSTMATMEVSDKAESVLDFYTKELKEKGWDISTETGAKAHQSLFARKGSSALVMDTSADKNGKTLINLTLTAQ